MFPHRERRSRLIAAFPDTIDAFVVTRLVNLRYLTGFTGSNGALLLPRDRSAVLAVDGRYTLQASAQTPDIERVDARSVAAALVAQARDLGLRRVGIEAGHVTLALHAALLTAAAGAVELVSLPPLVEPLRAVKDVAEVAALRRACEITDLAYSTVIDGLRPGVTERAVGWQLETAIRTHGGEGLSFDSIVAFGPHSAIPHHEPDDRPLTRGDLVKLDFGATYDGYHADMTRVVVVGPAEDWQRDLHAEVLAIQTACRAACVPGAVPVQLDQQAGAAIEAVGHHVAHGLGHGVGLEIHEDPFLTPGSMAPALQPAMTVTIEPGIYLPDRGGVRIEDTMLVGEAGSVPLTTSSRELLEVG